YPYATSPVSPDASGRVRSFRLCCQTHSSTRYPTKVKLPRYSWSKTNSHEIPYPHQTVSFRIHTYRTSGGHRHHRDFGCHAAAGVVFGQGEGQACDLRES